MKKIQKSEGDHVVCAHLISLNHNVSLVWRSMLMITIKLDVFVCDLEETTTYVCQEPSARNKSDSGNRFQSCRGGIKVSREPLPDASELG